MQQKCDAEDTKGGLSIYLSHHTDRSVSRLELLQ